MANIPISQIDTTASNVSDGDLFLLSKKNTDGTYTSAKIDASKIAAITKQKYVTTNPRVYISPNGSDDNFEKQFEAYGTNDQINYPLFTLNKACDFLNRFVTSKENMYRFIYCFPGTYEYPYQQKINGPYMERETAIYVRPQNEDSSVGVTFKRTYDSSQSYQSFIITNCNAVFKNVKIEGLDSWNDDSYSYGVESFSSLLTFYGSEICNFKIGVQCSFAGATLQIRSDYTDEGTIETIETNHKPFYIHDCDYGVACYLGRHINIRGWSKFDVVSYAIHSTAYNYVSVGSPSSSGGPSRMDVKTQNHNKTDGFWPIWSDGNYCFIRFTPGCVLNVYNTLRQYNSETYVKELFNMDSVSTIDLTSGSKVQIENSDVIHLNVNKF